MALTRSHSFSLGQQDVYWNFRNNYKTIFIQSARSVVQPYLVAPTLRVYNSISSFWTNNIKRYTKLSDSYPPPLLQTCITHPRVSILFLSFVGLCCEGRLLLSLPPLPTPLLERTEPYTATACVQQPPTPFLVLI
jgi:hypothetical protein